MDQGWKEKEKPLYLPPRNMYYSFVMYITEPLTLITIFLPIKKNLHT